MPSDPANLLKELLRLSPQHEKLVNIAGAVIAAAMIAAFVGFPSLFGSNEPPAGVETYRDGDLLCWDKTVCCPDGNCETIPTCIMSAE